jgi:DNA-binding protein HU-beta
MNKSDLIAAVTKSARLTKTQATQAVETVFASITQTLRKGGEATFVGFGSFRVTKRAAREGRNPRTGQKIKIAASKLPRFRPGKKLREAVS